MPDTRRDGVPYNPLLNDDAVRVTHLKLAYEFLDQPGWDGVLGRAAHALVRDNLRAEIDHLVERLKENGGLAGHG
jgi:hypothetical protein